MKRFLSIILMVVAFAAASCNNYDEQIAQLQQQLDKLTSEKGSLSDAITSLSTLVAQLEKGSKVAVFTPVTNDAGNVTGYSVKFENGETVTLYN
ncbi:MAG: hypothetical protein HUJ91_06195, partial [Bacteroidales bacterium]|nr:hypothetical protein [Bacteroidales bacterium]